jgi:hypothetical protein
MRLLCVPRIQGKIFGTKIIVMTLSGGARWSSLLKHYATSWKVAGSIPDEVIVFINSPNAYSRTMALGSTPPLIGMSTRNLPGG